MLFLTVALLTKTTVVSYGYTPDDNPKTELLKVDSVYRRAQNNFEQYVHRLYDDLNDESLQYELLAEGLTGYLNLKKSGQVRRPDILTLIDFSKPSNETRFYIVDLCQRKIVHKSLVAHGRNSGSLYAKYFSNETNSHQSSLGFYVTGSTYSGKYDLALRLEGKEHSNSRAMSRGVVMHAAKYATKERRSSGTFLWMSCTSN